MGYLGVLCVAIVFATTVSAASACVPGKPSRRNRWVAQRAVWRMVRKDKALAARFLRAAFHDCFSASKAIKGSGCNGSLRSEAELNDVRNGGLRPLIRKIIPIAKKTCVSVADLLHYGSSAGVYLTGGPYTNPGGGRQDSPQGAQDDPASLPPSDPPNRATFNKIRVAYQNQGFKSPRDLVVSIVGGHAIGGSLGGLLSFTPHPFLFDSSYARTLLQLHKQQANKANTVTAANGFHPLQSDLALFEDPNCLFWIKYYADKTPTSQGSRKTRGDKRLHKDFPVFMHRVGKLVVS